MGILKALVLGIKLMPSPVSSFPVIDTDDPSIRVPRFFRPYFANPPTVVRLVRNHFLFKQQPPRG